MLIRICCNFFVSLYCCIARYGCSVGKGDYIVGLGQISHFFFCKGSEECFFFGEYKTFTLIAAFSNFCFKFNNHNYFLSFVV